MRARARARRSVSDARAVRVAAQATPLEPGPLEILAQQAVDAARAVGASYADARLTRTVQHHYEFLGASRNCHLTGDVETVGVGIRVLVDGYWGFTASPIRDAEEVVRLVHEAV